MLSYEKNFAPREDGRFVCSKAGLMEMIRQYKPKLSLPENLDDKSFAKWQSEVKAKLTELLQLPPMTEQPAPKLISTEQKDGYRVEKWEFYPDDYLAVPYLALIPDSASKENKVPAVLCLLGSNYNKEFAAGVDQINHPNCNNRSFPDRNRMGRYMAENGMAAYVFENPAIGETSLMGDAAFGEKQWETRITMSYGYLQMGFNYVGLSVFQKLVFLNHLANFDYVDQGKIGIAAHSLGTVPAISIGLLSDKVKAVVFNDNLGDIMQRFAAVTEEPENNMRHDGMWHIIPGFSKYFNYPDICAAFAPRYLAFTEGGADVDLNVVRRAYNIQNADEHLQITHYPMFADETLRTFHGKIPDRGLSIESLNYLYRYVNAPDHSFRKEPAIKLFKDAFGLK